MRYTNPPLPAARKDREMSDDEGPNWKPRIIDKEVRVSETTLPNGVVIQMEMHFGEVDMAHFQRMCMLHPIVRFT